MPADASRPRCEHVALGPDPIDPAELIHRVRTDAAGAVALFTGVVRDHHDGKRVEGLTYEAYGPMAEREMRRIAAEAVAAWSLEGIAVVHRLGYLKVGEVSVAVAASAAHRRQAIGACAETIDRVKMEVPIWKKEHGEGGEGWVLGDDAPGSASGAVAGPHGPAGRSGGEEP